VGGARHVERRRGSGVGFQGDVGNDQGLEVPARLFAEDVVKGRCCGRRFHRRLQLVGNLLCKQVGEGIGHVARRFCCLDCFGREGINGLTDFLERDLGRHLLFCFRDGGRLEFGCGVGSGRKIQDKW